MTTQTLGRSDLQTPRLAYGCMRIVGTWNPAEVTAEREETAFAALRAAYDAGYTLFDHADIYCRGVCESVHGKFMQGSPELRRQTLIATKCGIRRQDDPKVGDPGRYDFSAEWIIRSCEGSLERLGVETIDLYQLHRPDVLMNPAEVAEAFARLHESGKVRWFGVSNFLPSHVALLQKALPFPIAVNQVEISLKRLDCFVDGTLDQCLEEGITPLSWSPVGGGGFGNAEVLALLDELAADHGLTRVAVALAWLLKHPSKIVPIVGSANPQHIRDAVQTDSIELTREDWYRLYVAARGERMP